MNDSTPNETTWNDVVEASAAAQRPHLDVEYVEDELSITLSSDDVMRMAEENAKRIEVREELEKRLESEKETVKATKNEIDALAREIDKCSKAMGLRRAKVTKRWKVVTIFATNTERWIDPDTGVVVREQAIPVERRQMAMSFSAPSPDTIGDETSSGDDDELIDDDRESIDDPQAILDGAAPDPNERPRVIRRRARSQ